MARILIIGTAHPYRGGLATFNERLAQQFQREGHEVALWTFTLQYPSFLFPGKTQYSSDPAPEGLTIERKLNSCNPLNWRKVAREARAWQPDILICCYWMAFFAPAYRTICKMQDPRCKRIALVHNLYAHEPSILDRVLLPGFLKSQYGFVTLSHSVAKHLIELTGKPVKVNPHPIYDHYGERLTKAEACRQLGLDSRKKYLLFFGLVRAYKGLDLLLKAMALLKSKDLHVHLLIAGEFYEDEEQYRQQIVRLGLSEQVTVRNEFIPDSAIKQYFGAADLVVQPYRSATQSGVTQVAFHFEKPILVTDVGGLGEIVHHGEMGYAVQPAAMPIAAAIEDYFTNDRQAAFTKAIQVEKSKYSWDKLTDKFLQI